MRKQDLPNCPEWLLKADTYNEDVEWSIFGYLIWNGGDFLGGDFLGGDFRGGNFRGGNFRGGNFLGGDFLGGNFLGGNFLGGDFCGGNFRGGNFLGGTMMPHNKWRCGVESNGLIRIGCKVKSMQEWDSWFAGNETFSTPRGTKEFAKIQANYLAVKTYVIFLEDFKKDNDGK